MPAEEAEQLWRRLRALSAQVAELGERVARLERRDDLEPVRAQLRDHAREVAELGDDLRDLLAADRKSAIEAITARQRSARPAASLGPPREVRAQVWSGAAAGLTALGTGLALGLAALLRGC